MKLTPELVRLAFEKGVEHFYEGPPPWYMKIFLAVVDDYFAKYYVSSSEEDAEVEVDTTIFEKLLQESAAYTPAKFDKEGKFIL